jgi:ACT domain-containing protein
MMGLQQEQTRLELVLEDRPGAFLEICRLIQEQGGEIVSLVSTTARHQGALKPVMIFRLEGVRPDPLVIGLEPAGHTLLSITT